MFNTKRKNEKSEVEVAICPLCDLRLEFIGAPMVRCYSTGETYEPEEIIWVLETEVSKDTGYDVENIRGNDKEQDFLPNAHPAADDKETQYRIRCRNQLFQLFFNLRSEIE